MTKYQRLLLDLEKTGKGTMKCFGTSMLPILQSGSTNTYSRKNNYAVGDIVFCKVKGRFIDAHKITKIGNDGRYLISNNKGHDNGWTRTIYGKVTKAVMPSGKVKVFK